MNENESAIQKLEEYVESMKKENVSYWRSIESLLPYLEDKHKEKKKDQTEIELEEDCRYLAEKLNDLASGKYYDTETGEMVDEIPEDCEDDERYQDLERYVIDDNLGIKIITDLDGGDLYGAEICTAWGGPNIYINTREAYIEGYWGYSEVRVPFSYDARDRINDYLDELKDCY